MAEEIKNPNPANDRTEVTAATRRPMGLPMRRLQTPEVPGYHLHWFIDGPRVERALEAGYEFVTKDEVYLNNRSVGSTDAAAAKGTDLGSRVTIVAGGDINPATGQAQRLVLMKLRNEWRQADMKVREDNADRMIAALRAGTAGDSQMSGDTDTSNRYVKTAQLGMRPLPRGTIFTKRN